MTWLLLMTRITSGVVIHLQRIGVTASTANRTTAKKDEGAVGDRHRPIGRITQTIYNRAIRSTDRDRTAFTTGILSSKDQQVGTQV